ncbi:MAG: sensor histidine kinase [Croceibacterium sp.]
MEVNHRSKNMLSTIQALARRTNSDEPGVMARFEDRVRSLAVNQDILVERQWREVPLRELVEAQLQFAAAAQGVIDAQGPDLLLRPRASEVVGMALHELATNSLKYGAMSTDGGKVHIRWERGADGFTLTWRESGGPPVQPPQRTGFGTKLILDVPRHNLSARVSLTYPEDGIAWKMDCDDAQLVDARA